MTADSAIENTLEDALSASALVDSLQRNQFTHVVWLPDSETEHLYNQLITCSGLSLIQVCREGEALGVALGLQVGGAKPVVIIQNTGFFESGDSIRGLGLNLRMPVVMLVSYRGWEASGEITDTAAIYLEGILQAWGLSYFIAQSNSDLHVISDAVSLAVREERPAVVLIAQELR